ncbi:uncharacterized protein B0T23DRAFT_237335 [Neurospora hispaniola]|uniref:Uncharacterized protein n=1 Tax=Neurospora hispaniola TaxID=588809 RepID=A0AAJ0I134_9PEZI|nr:hypothetical protein B0T23DRAFT_237335 [Neurospora hispaniola]
MTPYQATSIRTRPSGSPSPSLTSNTTSPKVPRWRHPTSTSHQTRPRRDQHPFSPGSATRDYHHHRSSEERSMGVTEARIGNTAASHLCRPSTPHMVLCYEGLTCFWGNLQKWHGMERYTADTVLPETMHGDNAPVWARDSEEGE